MRFFNSLLLTSIIVLVSGCFPDPIDPSVACNDPAATISLHKPDDNDLNLNNFFFEELPEDVIVKAGSEAQIAAVVQESGNLFRVIVNAYAEAIYYADAETPRRTMWENNNQCYGGLREGVLDIPIPAGAKPAPGTDEQLTIIDQTDPNNVIVYELTNARTPAANCYADCAEYSGISVAPLKNTGVVRSDPNNNLSGTRGGGFLGMNGMIWPQELNAGEIKHALRGSYNLTREDHVTPAIKSDGQQPTSNGSALPMGSLLQLDPSFNIDAQTSWTNDERTIAKAMQKYGIYIGDTNGYGLTVKGVAVQSFDCNPYRNFTESTSSSGGCTNTFSGRLIINNIPLNKLRVIEFPNSHPFAITEDIGNYTTKTCCSFNGCTNFLCF